MKDIHYGSILQFHLAIKSVFCYSTDTLENSKLSIFAPLVNVGKINVWVVLQICMRYPGIHKILWFLRNSSKFEEKMS